VLLETTLTYNLWKHVKRVKFNTALEAWCPLASIPGDANACFICRDILNRYIWVFSIAVILSVTV